MLGFINAKVLGRLDCMDMQACLSIHSLQVQLSIKTLCVDSFIHLFVT